MRKNNLCFCPLISCVDNGFVSTGAKANEGCNITKTLFEKYAYSRLEYIFSLI
jgi:hypothetical protein